MADSNAPYIIVVGVDFSESSEVALESAFQIADDRYPADVHAVNVVPSFVPSATPDGDVIDGQFPQSIGDANTRLRNYVEEKLVAHQEKGVRRAPWRVVTHVRTDSAAHEVAQLAADLQADLVVVGTNNRKGISRLLLGSTAEATVRLAPCPVLVARPKLAPASTEPAIEPPCPRCVQTRIDTKGAELWCDQHRERHGQRHTYHQGDRVSADNSMPLVMRS